jgi:aldoxime dehydratase
VDEAGARNEILLAYWRTARDFASWRAEPAVCQCLEAVHPVGLWMEAFSCPQPQMETSYSNETANWGLAAGCPKFLERQHSYAGAMRDRMVAAENDGLPPACPALSQRLAIPASRGAQLRIDLPANLCFIRTVQGWRACGVDERTDFLENMFPIYRTGVDYLQKHPREADCFSARLTEIENPDAQIQTQTLAWFRSLAHLESWAHLHPTHDAILKGFRDFALRREMKVDVILGHEVYVVPGGASEAYYSNCHPHTGFLPYFPARGTN